MYLLVILYFLAVLFVYSKKIYVEEILPNISQILYNKRFVDLDPPRPLIQFDIFNGVRQYCLYQHGEDALKVTWRLNGKIEIPVVVGMIIDNQIHSLYKFKKGYVMLINKTNLKLFIKKYSFDYLILKKPVLKGQLIRVYLLAENSGYFETPHLRNIRKFDDCEHLSTVRHYLDGSVKCLITAKDAYGYEFQSLSDSYLTVTSFDHTIYDSRILRSNIHWKCRPLVHKKIPEAEIKKLKIEEAKKAFMLIISCILLSFSLAFIFCVTAFKIVKRMIGKIKTWICSRPKKVKNENYINYYRLRKYINRLYEEISCSSTYSDTKEVNSISTILERGRIRLNPESPTFEECFNYYEQKMLDSELEITRREYSRTLKLASNIGVPKNILLKTLFRDNRGALQLEIEERFSPLGDNQRSMEIVSVIREFDTTAPMFYKLNSSYITCIREEQRKVRNRREHDNDYLQCSDSYMCYANHFLMIEDVSDYIHENERLHISSVQLTDETWEFLSQQMPNEIIFDGESVKNDDNVIYILHQYVLANYKLFEDPVYVEEHMDVIIESYHTKVYTKWIVNTSKK